MTKNIIIEEGKTNKFYIFVLMLMKYFYIKTNYMMPMEKMTNDCCDYKKMSKNGLRVSKLEHKRYINYLKNSIIDGDEFTQFTEVKNDNEKLIDFIQNNDKPNFLNSGILFCSKSNAFE